MWAIYALGSSVTAAVNSIFQKETLKHLHAVQLMTVTTILTSIMGVGYLIFKHPSLDLKLFSLILIYGVMTAFATVFTIRAMRHLDVSVVAPFFNLGTAFTAVLAFIFFKERVGLIGWVGITILILGGYYLELKHRNPLQPIKDIIKSDSIHYLLGGVFLFSASHLVAKYILQFTSPLSLMSYSQIIALIIYLFFTFFFYKGTKDITSGYQKGGWILFAVAAMHFLENILIFEALNIGEAILVVPLYRTWTLWAVILGGRILHEQHLGKRIIASCLMIFGAILILV